MSKIPVLVCAPASDAVFVTRGSVVAHTCSRCSRMVTMASTGQAYMRRNPGAVIICIYCYEKGPAGKHAGWIQADGTVGSDTSAIKNEQRDIMPNMWRKRN